MTARELLAREGQPVLRRSLNSHHGDQGQLLTVGATVAALRWLAWLVGGAVASLTAVVRRLWSLVTRDDDLAAEVRTLVWFGGLVVVAAVLALP